MSPPARRRLLAFDWPGNVRQLRNVVESMVVVDYDGLLDVDDLPEELAEPAGAVARAADDLAGRPGGPIVGGGRAAVHRRDAAGLPAAIARRPPSMLGIGERTLYRKIKEYGL